MNCCVLVRNWIGIAKRTKPKQLTRQFGEKVRANVV
jgi:hypothetical protein